MISITIQSVHSIPLVIPAGRIDSTNSAEFDQAIRSLVEKENYLIIDLSKCNYLSSAGIRILLLSEKKLLAKGGGLFLSGISPEVFQVIEMAGLHRVFRVFGSPEAAHGEIERIQIKERGSCEWTDGTFAFQFHQIVRERQPALLWENQGIAGYNELNVAIGTGSPCETTEEDVPSRGIFITNGRCTGFIPHDAGLPSDFRIPQNPANAGIFTKQAVSFASQPAGLVRLSEPSSILLGQLADGLYQMKRRLASGHHDLMAVVIADFNPDLPSVLICLQVDRELRDALKQPEFVELSALILEGGQGAGLWGARFTLDQVPQAPQDISLSNFLDHVLTFENIVDVRIIQPGERVVNPISWMFVSDGIADASTSRLRIETSGEMQLDPAKAFLTRRLYNDSARLIVKSLHGGYSAQTFQVTSFDHQGRKLRPTVLKIADRAIITRESDRCQKFALPYILNNSAMVLGTEFLGNTGALRYNFVGIGGEQSQLKWLTHYFTSWPVEQLEPLFDKIFMQILNPWYGQPVPETIYPFRDHDPTFTFFPTLCETAAEQLHVSSDDEFIHVEETGRGLINPYWFLKNEFARLRGMGMEYFTSICHGDLNMQNILLDEDMNVYLIDFSETRPRSLISDFARLEAIFMVEHAPVANEQEMEEYVKFLFRFYKNLRLGEAPEISYQGAHQERINRITALTLKMREYAFTGVHGDPNPVPYCLALLEWVLPVVCYSSAPIANKRLSMIVSGLLCDIVMRP